MRFYYTFLLLLAFSGVAHTQLIIGAENAPQIGDKWAIYVDFVPSADFPVPAVGADIAYDFSSFGDLIEEELGIAFKDISDDSISTATVREVPVGTGEPALDDLPASALLLDYELLSNDGSGNVLSLPDVIDVTDDGVFVLVTSDLAIVDDEVAVVYEALPFPRLFLEFGLRPGDTRTSNTTNTTINEELNVEDSTSISRTRTYVGNGSLKTWFAEYEEVAVIKEVFQVRFYTRPIGSTDPFSIAGVQTNISYEFLRAGSFAPVVDYSFDTSNAETQPVPERVRISISRPIRLTNVETVSAAALGLSVSPNPAVEAVSVTFEQRVAGPVRLRLVDAAGRVVLTRDAGTLPAGTHQVPLTLPAGLSAGTYFVQLVSDGGAAAVSLLVGDR